MNPMWSRVISARDIAACKAFAEKCYDTNKDEYARRNQDNRDKIVWDITIGKMAEIAVYFFLRDEKKVECSQPDFLIYAAKKKNYGADLTFTGKDGVLYDLHVKSQDKQQGERFGKSWMFQKKDTLTHAPKENEMICLCTIDNNEVHIDYMRKAAKFIGVYSEPKAERLRESKTAIYAEHL